MVANHQSRKHKGGVTYEKDSRRNGYIGDIDGGTFIILIHTGEGLHDKRRELKVLSADVLTPVLTGLVGEFERTTSTRSHLILATTGVVRDRVRSGEYADIAIMQRPAISSSRKTARSLPAASSILAARRLRWVCALEHQSPISQSLKGSDARS